MSLVVPFKKIFESKTGLLANHASWERVELGEVCEILNGFPFKSTLFNRSKGFPVIRIRDLTKGTTETFFDGEFPPEYIVQNGDLLIGMDGIFRCCEWQDGEAGLNQRVCKIIPNEKHLARKFLLYGLNGYLKAIEDATSSVTVGHLSSRDVLRIPFPLPPLNEQRRIVAKLETLLGKADACQQRLAKIPVILKRFRQAVLAAACSGRLTADWREGNADVVGATGSVAHGGDTASPLQGRGEWEELPEGWSFAYVNDVVSSLKYGTAQKCSYEKRGVPVLRIPNVSEGVVSHDDLKYAALPEKEYQSLCLQSGDILVIRSNGSVSLVGKSALVREAEQGFAYAGYLIRLRPDTKLVAPEYLNIVLGSYPVRVQIEVPARSTSGVNNINSDELRALEIPLPPLPEQHEIVRRVEALFTLADQLEARYAKAKTHVDRLTQSILAKAFRGELVPQDEMDEPASVLLERIQAQRSQVAPVKRKAAPSQSPRRERKKNPAEPASAPLVAEAPAKYYGNIPQAILAHMKPGAEYSRKDIVDALNLSTSDWNWAIQQLKEKGTVLQKGERRGTRYKLALLR